MTDLRNLKVLEAALCLVETVHHAVDRLDSYRAPRLRSQLLGAIDSVPANIAEGARGTRPEFAHYLRVALRSTDEAGVHLLIAKRIRALPRDAYWRCENRRVTVCRMLNQLIRSVEEQHARQTQRPR